MVAKLEKLKSLMSHQLETFQYGELIERLADLALERVDPGALGKNERERRRARKYIKAPEATWASTSPDTNRCVTTHESRRPGAETRDRTWLGANGTCAYISPITGRRCESALRTQFDHIQDWSLGGPSGWIISSSTAPNITGSKQFKPTVQP